MKMDNIKRIEHFDLSRGLAIFSVVFVHLIQRHYINDYLSNTLFLFFNSFYMPFFMFLSGQTSFFSLSKITSIDSVNEFIFKKTKQLLVPYLTWYFIVDYFLYRGFNSFSFYEYSERLLSSPDYGLWFLWVLYLISITNCIIYFIFSKIINSFVKDLLTGFIVFLIFLFLKIYSNVGLFNTSYYFYIFYFLGYMMHKYYKIDSILKNKYLMLLLIIVYAYLFRGYSFENTNIIVRIVIALSGLLIAFNIITDFPINGQIKNVLEYLGKKSMYVYCIHFYFLNFVIIGNFKTLDVVLFAIFYSLIVIFLSLSTYQIIRNLPLFRSMLLGINGSKKNKIIINSTDLKA